MKRVVWGIAGLVLALGCSDFDALFDDCVDAGRCEGAAAGGDGGDRGDAGDAGDGGSGDGGSGDGGSGDGGTATDAGGDGGVGPFTANLTASPTPVAFGSRRIGAANPTVDVTLSNDGGLPSGVIGSTILGADSADFFHALGSCAVGVAPGGSCTLSVGFVAGDAGPRGATLRIAYGLNGQLDLPLSGTGLRPASLGLAPAGRNLGDVDAGSPHVASFVLRNGGDEDAPIGDAFIVGDPAGLSVTDTCGAILAGQAECQVDAVVQSPTFVVVDAGVRVEMTDGGSATTLVSARVIDDVTLAISVQGDGGVLWGDGGCTGSCTPRFRRFSDVSFVPVETAETSFAGWSEACTGDAGCTVSLAAPASLTASFETRTFPLFWSAPDGGGVELQPAGVPCGPQCARFPLGTTVTATPSFRYGPFERWGGDCPSALSATCPLQMTARRDLTVHFGRYNIAFVTSGSWPADALGGVSGADALCAAAARDAGFPPGDRYVALLGPMNSNVKDRLDGGSGWVRPDGLPFADSQTSLFTDGKIFYPLVIDEHGGTIAPPGFVRTGAQKDGTVLGFLNCENFTTDAGDHLAGKAWAAKDNWIHRGAQACATPLPLYCFGTDYTTPVAPAPVPDGGLLAFLTHSAFVGPFGGVDGGDGSCVTEAASTGRTRPGTTFLALLSTVDTPFQFGSGGPWYRVDGVKVAENGQAFESATGAALNVTQHGMHQNGEALVWTGAPPTTSAPATEDCGGAWTDGGFGIYGGAGLANQLDSDRYLSARVECLFPSFARFYCLESRTFRDGGAVP